MTRETYNLEAPTAEEALGEHGLNAKPTYSLPSEISDQARDRIADQID